MRINAGVRQFGLSYSRFMHGLKLAKIALNRKVLANMAIENKDDFAVLANMASEALKK